jgi:hypothetical protein
MGCWCHPNSEECASFTYSWETHIHTAKLLPKFQYCRDVVIIPQLNAQIHNDLNQNPGRFSIEINKLVTKII